MADLPERQINSNFQGLVSTCVIFAVVGSISAITYESLRQLRRLPRTRFSKFWRKDADLRHSPGGVQDNPAHARHKHTCEDWEMGHFYLSRVFHASTPSPMLPRWPFAWVKLAISFTDEWYADHTGMDTVVYVRFLRACLFWVLLHCFTTAPILLSIHITFSRGTSTTDMQRASLSYLVNTPAPDCTEQDRSKCKLLPNEKGSSLLWVHLVLLWYISITWVLALWWIGKGSLTLRKAQIAKTRNNVIQAKTQARSAPPNSTLASATPLHHDPHTNLTAAHGITSDNSDGWRQRSLMVMNLPATMRDEASIRRYFEEFLRPDDDDTLSTYAHTDYAPQTASHNPDTQHTSVSDAHHPSSCDEHRAAPPTAYSTHSDGPDGPQPDLHPNRYLKSPIQTVVLVRKMNELASMLSRRQEVLTQLEAAHVKLAQEVLVTVGRRTLKMRKQERSKAKEACYPNDHRPSSSRSSFFFNRLLRSRRQSNHSVQAASASSSGTTTPSEALDPDLEKLGTAHSSAGKALEEELARRLARFSPTNRGLHAKQTQTIQGDDRSNQHEMGETVWEALNELPRELLDPFQPATRLSALFRGQTVPTIDYLLTKLNLLTALVTEMRSRPPTSYEPTSTAFVTFRDPRQARMVWRELKDQIVVKVRLAPEVKDLDWDRLMKTSFTVDVVRGFGVSIVTWGFTIFWVIIINAIVLGIFSVDKLKQIPGLGNFFDNNPKLTGFVTITLPPLLVSLASMSVPELIFQVSKRAQGFVTFSALYDMCLARYWKFVICNVVIFFSVGSTVIVTVLTKVGNTGSILSTVASAFPSAAPFFVSYLILQLALQSGFEHMGFMIALLQHLGARKATTPRTRAIKTLPRNFNRYYWLPLHINIMAIVFIFALLNPLVIPFALVYLALALVIFKKNFAYHYYRRFNEMEGVVYFTRLLRYSLDAIVVMQAVLLIFFSVLKKKPVYIGMSAVLIPLTVITKLIATRLWKSQCRALDDEEAEALCGIDSRPLWQKVQRNDMGPSTAEEGSDSRGPLDALASGRYPAIVPPPPTDSAFQRVWQRLHDSFNANGLDGQSYLATAHAKGKAPTGAVSLGAKGIARTPRYIVKETAKHAFHYRHAAKNSLGMKVLVESPRASRDRPSVDRRRPVSGLPPTSQLHVHVLRNSHEVAAATDPAAAADDDDDVDRADGEMPNHRSSNPQRSKSTSHGQKGDHVIHRRRGSSRSEDRPFLSGFDAISTHAPLPSEDDYDLSFEDGDAPFLEHDEQGHLLRQSSRRSKRTASRHHGTLRRKPSQLATVADEELPQSADSATSSTQPEGATSTDPLCQQYASQTAQHAAVKTDQTWGKSSQRSHYEDYDDSLKGRELVRPHPPVRWDDTPNNTARYNNPFYNQEMDDFLWLPRNPLAPIDLFDTIEWYGPALVSSQGGGGIMGEWDDDQDDVNYDTEDEEKLVMHHDEIPFGGEAATLARSQDLMLAGDEEILLPDRLARHLEETQGIEQVVDPAASIPKSMMDDYKRALGRNRDRRGSTTSRSQHSVSRSSLFRRGSNLSSPSAQGFAGGASLLQVPSHGSFCSSDGSQAAASATQMRSSQRPGTGDSEPLASVDEGGVVVPRRSSSRDRRSRDARAGGGEEGGEAYEHVEQGGGGGGAAEQTTDLTPAKRREATLSGVKRNMSRRTYRRDASGALSRVSGISGETAQKTVTLQAALRAEALEEERRLTLKERLVASKIRKKRNVKRDGSGHLAGLEEMNADEEDDDEEEGATSRRATNRSKIMERYEAQHRRREAQASEFGQLTPRKEGGMRRDVSQGSQLGGEVSQSGLDRSASVASGFGARRLRSAALGVLSLTRSPRLGQDGPLTIVTSVPMQELRGGRPTTRGSSRMDAESQASASRQGVAVATASNEDQRPQMVEASNTESVLRAEASRTSALEESVISGGQGGS